MFQHRLFVCVWLAAVLAGCGAAGTSGTFPVPLAADRNAVSSQPKPPYVCFPKIPRSAAREPHIAYATACSVAGSPDRAALQKLAAALMVSSGNSFIEYCTGTPIAFDEKTHVGFVVSAAHCVVGGQKAAGAEIVAGNITTFDTKRNRAELYQGTPGLVLSEAELTAKNMAVYVPSQFCKAAAFQSDGAGCSSFDEQDGDIAVVKVQAGANGLGVLSNMRVASAQLALEHFTTIMALGYGFNTSATPEDRVLNYVDYEYYANDAYKGVTSQASIMNGFVQGGRYYSIVCQGDSGGGDFYWDGTHWNLVGAHSWGPIPCGESGATYGDAFDVSADVRPFGEWIDRIVREDATASGCASLGARYVCASRHS